MTTWLICAACFKSALLDAGAYRVATSTFFVLTIGLAGTAGVMTIARSERAMRKELARRPCWECGYSLIGLTEPRCPECGTEFDPAGYEAIEKAMNVDGRSRQGPTEL